MPISTELNGLVCLFIAIDVEGKPSAGNALQDVKILSLRDPVSETCNLVINHIIILILDALTTELKCLEEKEETDIWQLVWMREKRKGLNPLFLFLIIILINFQVLESTM